VLIKNSSTNYDTNWVNYIPTGGTANQLLRKVDNVNYNTQWVDNVLPYYIQAGNGSGQSIPTTQATTINGWTNNTITIEGAWNNTTGIFTCQRAGYYSFSVSIAYAIHSAPVNSEYNIAIAINGVASFTSAFFRQSAENVLLQVPQVQGIRFLNIGDTVSFNAFQSSGASRSLWIRGDVNIMVIQELPNQIIK
jgi:hypothetical protein